METISDFLFVVSPDGIILHINQAVADFLNIKTGDILGLSFRNYFVEKEKVDQLLLETKSTRSTELTMINDRTQIPVFTSFSILSTEKKQISGFVFLAKDISRIKEVHDELEQEKLRADEANKAKSEFLSNISHELRTPLNAIIGYSELLIEEVEDKSYELLGSHLPMIKNSGGYLLDLINNILDISKIEAKRFTLAPENINLQEFMDDIKSVVHVQAGKTIRLSCLKIVANQNIFIAIAKD